MSGLLSCITLILGLTICGPGHPDEEGLVVGGKAAAATKQDLEELRVFATEEIVQPYQDPYYPPFGRLFGRIAWEQVATDSPRALWPLDGADGEEVIRTLFPLHEERRGPLEPDELLELLRQQTVDAWERDGTWIQVSDYSRLTALNARSVLDGLASRLQQLRLELVPRYDFRFVLYALTPGESDGTSTTLSLADAEALHQRVATGQLGRRLHVSRAASRIGDTLQFGAFHRGGLQSDLNVEVAQESAIADPVVQKLLLGNGLNVTAMLCPNGKDLALFGLFTSRRDPEEVRSLDLGSRQLNSIEVGRFGQCQSAFTVRLPGEGGIVLRPGGSEWPGLRMLLVVRRLDPWPRPDEGRAVIHHGVLTSPVLTSDEDGLAGIGFRPVQCDEIMEMIRSVFEKHGDDFQCESTDAFLLVSGPPEAVKAGAGLARFLGRGHRRSFRIEIVREMQPAKASKDEWEPLGAPIEVLCLGSRIGFAEAGREQLFVGDHDVEVASKSKIGDPITSSCFDGVQVVAGVEPQADGLRVRLALLDRSLLGFRTLPIGSPDVGPSQTPRMQEVVLRRTVTCKPGETRALGDGAVRLLDGGGRCRTRLSMRLTEL